jgi:poly-D-alanine transfer protein DltD
MVTQKKTVGKVSLWKLPIHLLRARCRRHQCLDTGTRSQLIHRLQRLKKTTSRGPKRVTARSRVYRKKTSSKKKSVLGRKVFRHVKHIMKSTPAYQSYPNLSALRLAKGKAAASRVMKQAWKLAGY